jgi:hypothetical protein
MAPAMLAAGYVGVAVAVFSAIQSTKESPSPFPAILEMLAQISKQVQSLRIDVMNRIGELDVKLSSMLDKTLTVANAIEYDTKMLRQAIGDLRKVLQVINNEITYQIATLGDLTLDAEDRRCFHWTGDQKLLPLNRDAFIECRDTYIDRATKYAYATNPLSSVSRGSIATASFLSPTTLFPFAESYETLRQDIAASEQENPNPIANPTIWFRSATLLVALIETSKDHFRDVAYLHPVIQTGSDIRRFRENIAIATDANRTLRVDRFLSLITKIFDVQFSVLNKVEQQIENGPIKADIPEGIAQAPNVDFPYQMLANGVNLCPGVLPRLLAVENVTITRSGGCCGTDEIVNQAAIKRPGVGRRLNPFSWMGDLRARVEAAIRGFDFRTISFDKSLIGAVNRPVVLMEQTGDKNAKTSMCVKQFDITKLNMSHATQTQVGLDLHLTIYLTVDGRKENPTFPVQELAGSAMTVTPFYHLYYDTTVRPDALIRAPWSQLRGHFDQFFKSVNNPEADKNGKEIEDEMKRFFAEKQAALYQAILAAIAPEKDELAHLKNDLLAISQVGLEPNNLAVQKWLNFIRDPRAIRPLDELVGAVVLHDQPMAAARQSVTEDKERMTAALTELSGSSDLAPLRDAISARLDDLNRINAIRASMAPTAAKVAPSGVNRAAN